MKDLQEMLTKAGHPSPDLFPFRSMLNFQPLLERWQREAEAGQSQEKAVNAFLQQYADEHPFLRQSIGDSAVLEELE